MKYIFTLLVGFLIALTGYSQTQFEMNQEAGREYEKKDKELNVLYKKLIAKLDETERNLFIQAQQAWLKFRDSHCKYEASSYEGGSMQPMVRYYCLAELTAARNEMLRNDLKNRNN